MVAAGPAANERIVLILWRDALGRFLAAAGLALPIWLLMRELLATKDAHLLLSERGRILLAVISMQLGCLSVSFLGRTGDAPACPCPARHRLGAFTAFLLAAVFLGVLYDVALDLLFGKGTATLGPWGEVRLVGLVPGSVLVVAGVLLGPAGDERFFRRDLFARWLGAGRPWSGAALSAALFALTRLDLWNLPAYFVLGLLLCALYTATRSLFAVWAAHGLLNLAMFAFLFAGYE